MELSAGTLPTAPFELNHALIDSIIQQQHRRVVGIPTEQEETEALLHDIASRLVAAGSTNACAATSSVTEPAAWLQPAESIADSLEGAPSDCVEPGSPLYFSCTELRARASSPCFPAADDHAFVRAPTFVQALAVLSLIHI